MDDRGSIAGPDFDALLRRITTRGLDQDAREIFWPYLLGLYDPSSTSRERSILLSSVRCAP